VKDIQSSDKDLIAHLQRYQEACNRYDINAALEMFADDGCIEVRGVQYCGRATLREAHEYDLGSRTQVRFDDFAVEGSLVRCRFTTCDEVDRVVGIDGLHMRAEFTFEGGRIRKFLSLPPDRAEMQRHREAKQAFRQWAREHYPEEVAKGFTFNYECGASLTKVAHAWRAGMAQRP
jgi:hypothetical protein